MVGKWKHLARVIMPLRTGVCRCPQPLLLVFVPIYSRMLAATLHDNLPPSNTSHSADDLSRQALPPLLFGVTISLLRDNFSSICEADIFLATINLT